MAKVRVTDNEEQCEVVINFNLLDDDEPLQIVKPDHPEAKIIQLNNERRTTKTTKGI